MKKLEKREGRMVDWVKNQKMEVEEKNEKKKEPPKKDRFLKIQIRRSFSPSRN